MATETIVYNPAQEPAEWLTILRWITWIDEALEEGTRSLAAEKVAGRVALTGWVPDDLGALDIAEDWLADLREVLADLWRGRWHDGRCRSVREAAAWALAATAEDNAVTGDCPERAFILASLALYGISDWEGHHRD